MSSTQSPETSSEASTTDEQDNYPDQHRGSSCPSPPESDSYESLEVVAKGPVTIERDVSLADPQEFVLQDRTTATVRTQISEFQELDPFLQRREKLDKRTALAQLTAYPSDPHVSIDSADIDDWEIEFRATVEDWQTVAGDLAENDSFTGSDPGTAVDKLRRLVCSDHTDDSAVFAVLNLVDKHDVDVDWHEEAFLKRAVDTDDEDA